MSASVSQKPKKRGFIDDWELFCLQSNLATSARAATCSDKRNPHVNHRKYKNGQYGALAKEEQYRVNVEHKLTEEQAVVLPLRRKLARHFA